MAQIVPSVMLSGRRTRGVPRVKKAGSAKRIATGIAGLLVLLATPLASAQLQIGDDFKMKVGGLFTAGYQGVYGDSSQIESNHGLDFGLNGNINGSYYNPNFLSFNIVPYVNQSQANSNYQSITGASGVSATANR